MQNGIYPQNNLFYKPFGNYDPKIVCEKLLENNISYVRQIVCLDEIFLDDDQLNEQYLQQYIDISKIFNKYGFKIILDFHQDIFSRKLGGCGLPKKYFPDNLKDTIIELSDPKLWGATPVKSKEQKQCWKHFYQNCIEMYIQDICKVIQWINNNINQKFSQIYQQIDIINEPGIPTMYKARFILGKNEYYKQRLSYLYSLGIQQLSKIVDDQTHFGIEPFNYDVSQTVYYSIGMQEIKGIDNNLQNRIIYVPHLYQPIFLSRKAHIISNHIKTQKQLSCQQIQINEFGDLSFNNELYILEKQIKLLIQLDLPMCIWELDITYQNQEQAWNNEDMSILQAYNMNGNIELLETECGNIYFSYTRRFQEYYLFNKNSVFKTLISDIQYQKLQYAFIVSQKQVPNIRLLCLNDNKFCKFINFQVNQIKEQFDEKLNNQLNIDSFDETQEIYLCLCNKKYYDNYIYVSFDQDERIILFKERQ